MKQTPLKRSAPLKRTAVNKVSDKRKAKLPILAKLKKDRMKIAGDRCERCYCDAAPFNPLDYAHILGVGRAPAMELDPENAVIWCRGCHTHMDTHPVEKEAYIKADYPGLWERLEQKNMEVKKG